MPPRWRAISALAPAGKMSLPDKRRPQHCGQLPQLDLVKRSGGDGWHYATMHGAAGAGCRSKTAQSQAIYRVMKVHGLLLDRHVGGDERRHDGRIAVDERNRRWCSDGFEIG